MVFPCVLGSLRKTVVLDINYTGYTRNYWHSSNLQVNWYVRLCEALAFGKRLPALRSAAFNCAVLMICFMEPLPGSGWVVMASSLVNEGSGSPCGLLLCVACCSPPGGSGGSNNLLVPFYPLTARSGCKWSTSAAKDSTVMSYGGELRTVVC